MKFLKFSFVLLILTATSSSWALTEAEKKNSQLVRERIEAVERGDHIKGYQEMMKPTDGKRRVNPSTGGKVIPK